MRLDRGVMTIERRWVDVQLPTRELLEATGRAYDYLVKVIRLAHDAANISICNLGTRRPECVGPQLVEQPQCMNQIDDNRRLHVGTMTQLTEGIEVLRLDDIPAEVTRAKYGEVKVSGDAIQRIPNATEMAQRMLAVDKGLATVAWLLRGQQTVDIFAMVMPDQNAKRVQMNRLADRVEYANADGVVFICESWYDLPRPATGVENRDSVPSHKRRNRGECICVAGITKDGRSAECITVFYRGRDGEIVFGPSTMTQSSSVNMLLPVIRRWHQMESRGRSKRD
jgi:hypothetical protein